MNNLFDLAGKVAVVTGGSRGIGAMIAKGFVEAGVKTYISARRDEELQETAKMLSGTGDHQAECIGIAADLSSLAGVQAFADEIKQRESKLDILINNAGATWGANFTEFPENGWDKTMDLNVKSLFFLSQQLHGLLCAAATDTDPARIVNIGSVNGLTNPHSTAYAYGASKAAVHHLTLHLGADLAADNINVNAIAPGFFPSKMTAHYMEHEAEMAAEIPRKRIGNPEDAAGTAIYLCARASAYVTGHTLALDGGITASR